MTFVCFFCFFFSEDKINQFNCQSTKHGKLFTTGCYVVSRGGTVMLVPPAKYFHIFVLYKDRHVIISYMRIERGHFFLGENYWFLLKGETFHQIFSIIFTPSQSICISIFQHFPLRWRGSSFLFSFSLFLFFSSCFLTFFLFFFFFFAKRLFSCQQFF